MRRNELAKTAATTGEVLNGKDVLCRRICSIVHFTFIMSLSGQKDNTRTNNFLRPDCTEKALKMSKIIPVDLYSIQDLTLNT
jgi:hypothetical protein